MKSWRIYLTLLLMGIFATTIIGRLVFLQFQQRDFYRALAAGQQKILASELGQRGEIFFQGGEPLAINRSSFYLFVSPKEIKEKEKVSRALSEALLEEEAPLLAKLSKNNLFEVIKRQLSEKEKNQIESMNFKGVYLAEEVIRYYPQKNLASNLAGFVTAEKQGHYGVEGYYDEILRGEEVLTEKEKGLFGYFSFSNSQKAAAGPDLILTLDQNIQFRSEALLVQAQENLGIRGGQIIVLEPQSGKILALAHLPNFDPNHYSQTPDIETFQNSVYQKIFEPGSVFKPFTIAAALAEQKIFPESTYVDYGEVKIGGETIYNYDRRTWGKRTMTEVLEKSINSGAVFAEAQLGHELFLRYLEKFGFFEPTRVDLQGEVYSENLEFKKGYEINFATASFGQGIEITPLQLARGFSVIANNGRMIRPHVIEKAIRDGVELNLERSSEEKQVISTEVALQLTSMLVSVIEKGFGKAAAVPGYFIAGKTGTAQVPWPALGIQKSGYSEETIQSFVGFAPAFNPRFLILVKLDNPQTKTAEYSATPIFQKLAKFIIDYWQIPPDYEP